MMGKEAPVLSGDRARYQVAGSLRRCQASIDFVQAAIEVIAEQIPRKIAIFEATVQDQPVTCFPTDGVVRSAEGSGSHDVINDMHQRRCGRLQRGELVQGGVATLFSKVLNLGVKRV